MDHARDFNDTATDNFGNSTLINAASHGHAAIVQSVLSMPSIDINAKNGQRDTALTLAARQGHITIVQSLLSKTGIHVNAVNDMGNTALILAANNGHAIIVQRLLSMPNIDINAKNLRGDTAFILATRQGHITIVHSLLSMTDIHVNAKNDYGNTALIDALQLDIVLALLAQPGIHVNARNKFGTTALIRAHSNHSNSKIITALEIAQQRERVITAYQHHSLTYAQAWVATMPEILELHDTLLLPSDLIPLVISYLTPLSYNEAKDLLPHLNSARSADYTAFLIDANSAMPCHRLSYATTTVTIRKANLEMENHTCRCTVA